MSEKVSIYVVVVEDGWVYTTSPGPLPSCSGSYTSDDAMARAHAAKVGKGVRNIYRVTLEVERPVSPVADAEAAVEEVKL